MAAFYWLHPWSCLAIKAPLLIAKVLSFSGELYSVSFVQSKENSRQKPGREINLKGTSDSANYAVTTGSNGSF